MTKVREIADAIEAFAPKNLQEDYDNSGLQVGNPDMDVTSILLCLDVTEEILEEAGHRECNMIVSHHPVIFKSLKSITGANPTQRIILEAIKKNIAIYSAHTNLDSASQGVSHEMAHLLNLKDVRVLEPKEDDSTGLGVIGIVSPTPKLEFLRKVKETFNVKALKYSSQSPQLVVRKVAACGGAGAFLIKEAIDNGADVIITGDVKYHDFTTYGQDIIITDIGHYESELCSRKIISRLMKEKFPDIDTFTSQKENNPITYM